MHSPLLAFVFALLGAAAVNAHFQLQFPPPRGVFVEDQEPNFCGMYSMHCTLANYMIEMILQMDTSTPSLIGQSFLLAVASSL
jgi:hypothetical protein